MRSQSSAGIRASECPGMPRHATRAAYDGALARTAEVAASLCRKLARAAWGQIGASEIWSASSMSLASVSGGSDERSCSA